MNKKEIDELILELQPTFKAIIYRFMSGRLNEFEDYLQEAYISAHKAVKYYDESKNANLKTFITTVVKNDLMVLSMRKTRENKLILDSAKAFEFASEVQSYEEDFAYNIDKQIKLRKLKSTLSTKEYQLINLLSNDYTFKDIDKIMNISTNERCVLVHNIKKKLINNNNK